MICEQINEELRQEQKVLVLLQLIEFISFSENISENELEFVKTVAEIFKIPDEEYENAKLFLFNQSDEIQDKSKLLIINNKDKIENKKLKEVVYGLLMGQDDPPVIIIQGDHGSGFLGSPASEDAYRERMGILNAYHLRKPAGLRLPGRAKMHRDVGV